MLIFSLFLFLCDLVVATNKVVTVTRYTTTTICPITTTFTSSGITVTTTKLTTSEVTVAIVQTVIVPGPTATRTQISVVNVTKILTSSDIITLPTVELTKRITSFATVVETPAVTLSTSTSCPSSTTKRTNVLSSNPTSTESGRTSMISSSSLSGHTNESKAPSSSLTSDKVKTTLVAAVTSEQPSVGVGSTIVYETQPPSQVVGISTVSSISQDRHVLTIVASTVVPTKTSNGDAQRVPSTGARESKTGNGETQQAPPTGTRDSPDGKVKPVPDLSQPPLAIESIGAVQPTDLPVISKGTMLYLPALVWLATIACVVSGMVWGAS